MKEISWKLIKHWNNSWKVQKLYENKNNVKWNYGIFMKSNEEVKKFNKKKFN